MLGQTPEPPQYKADHLCTNVMHASVNSLNHGGTVLQNQRRHNHSSQRLSQHNLPQIDAGSVYPDVCQKYAHSIELTTLVGIIQL